MSKWFVMLVGGNDMPLPLMDGDDNVAVFDSERKAELAGADNCLGAARGFQTYEWFDQ